MVTICGRNSDEMFFLTRHGDIEITEVGYPKYVKGGLYHYARQSIQADSKEELDAFGRNHTDRSFIRLCDAVFGMVMGKEDTFKSLSCKKEENAYVEEGYLYHVRVGIGNEVLDGELSVMVELYEERAKGRSGK